MKSQKQFRLSTLANKEKARILGGCNCQSCCATCPSCPGQDGTLVTGFMKGAGSIVKNDELAHP